MEDSSVRPAELDPLEAEGWVRRSVASEPRLSEIADLYRELGMEVRLLPVADVAGQEGQHGVCTTCLTFDADPGRFKVVYTREASRSGGPEEGAAHPAAPAKGVIT